MSEGLPGVDATGIAIIAALLALGESVATIHAYYKKHVPDVMGQSSADDKSAALKRLATEVFDGKTFADTRTGLGIVATRWDFERPMIFKSLLEPVDVMLIPGGMHGSKLISLVEYRQRHEPRYILFISVTRKTSQLP